MVREAALEDEGAGLAAASEGWFVLNARDARWIRRDGRGYNLPFTGWTAHEAETYFRQLGIGLAVLAPGEPLSMYHWESDQENVLMLSGEATLVVEGEERPLRAWDFVHLPPGTRHVVVGAGANGCIAVAIGARAHQTSDWGGYAADEAARRHGASPDEDTDDSTVAYGRFGPSEPTRYRDGWLEG